MSWLDNIILWFYDWWVGTRDDNDHEPRGPPMKRIFPSAVEVGREKRDPRFKSDVGDRFGLFRFQSPKTGATLRCIVCSAEESAKHEVVADHWDHVSVSLMTRTPTWDEMCFVKELFFEDAECVVQFHPAKTDYVNLNENVLHLWRPADGVVRMPPKECV